MNQLGLIIKNEYLTDIKNKSFWITTFLAPILMLAFGFFMGYLMEDTESIQKISNPTAPEPEEMSGMQIFGMFTGILLALFLMIYGSQIFNKVKKEKCNRIMEVLATSVTGRTMMLGKVISVGLLGITQLLMWFGIMLLGFVAVITVFHPDIPWDKITDIRVLVGAIWSFLFFMGGYVFYGAIYAACGAMTDKDNENQGYMTLITFLLLGSFYIAQFAVTHSSSPLVVFCSFFPFTSATVASVNAVAQSVPIWESIMALVVLYAFAALSVIFAGKIYTGALLLKGTKFTPRDILLFMKMK